MTTHRIAVIPGDGIGKEVVPEGLRVLEKAAARFGLAFEFAHFDWNCDYYARTGRMMPEDWFETLSSFEAIFYGAVGWPATVPDHVSLWGSLIQFRRRFDQYVNLRPCRLMPGIATPLANRKPGDIDFVVVRENTEGLYAGAGGNLRRGTPHEVAVQESINTRMGVERCLRYAFEYTRKRGRRKTLTLCGKTNALTYAFDLWERAFHEIGDKDYPDIKRDYAHVDATCMWMVKNPEWFDVIVTDNMFGDIITDLGAMIQGGMGIAAGGNIHPGKVSMFEPIGGSAPKYTGLGVINPMAAIASAQMMLAELGENEAADRVESAIAYVAAEKLESMNAGKMGYSTSGVGDLVADAVATKAGQK